MSVAYKICHSRMFVVIEKAIKSSTEYKGIWKRLIKKTHASKKGKSLKKKKKKKQYSVTLG